MTDAVNLSTGGGGPISAALDSRLAGCTGGGWGRVQAVHQASEDVDLEALSTAVLKHLSKRKEWCGQKGGMMWAEGTGGVGRGEWWRGQKGMVMCVQGDGGVSRDVCARASEYGQLQSCSPSRLKNSL